MISAIIFGITSIFVLSEFAVLLVPPTEYEKSLHPRTKRSSDAAIRLIIICVWIIPGIYLFG